MAEHRRTVWAAVSGEGRLMSCAETIEGVRSRRKTVTRRQGWWQDKRGRELLVRGDRLQLCEKVMGRQGAPLVRLAVVEVTSVRRERLSAMPDEDVPREAVPGMENVSAEEWVAWYCETFGVTPDSLVTRIEFRYLDAP